MFFFPKLTDNTKNFLLSDYVDSEIRNELLEAIQICGSRTMAELLSSGKKLNDFSKEEIDSILEYLGYAYQIHQDNESKSRCYNIHGILKDYLFMLDGEGPVKFIKERYGEGLPYEILKRSGVADFPSYYAGLGENRTHLGEDHLFSVYLKLKKYYPGTESTFVDMVNSLPVISGCEFVANYLIFVKSGFIYDYKFKKYDDSDRLDKALSCVAAVASVLDEDNQTDDYWGRRFQSNNHKLIVDGFNKKVEDYKASLIKGQSKELKDNRE